jgi:hypothetical protein
MPGPAAISAKVGNMVNQDQQKKQTSDVEPEPGQEDAFQNHERVQKVPKYPAG